MGMSLSLGLSLSSLRSGVWSPARLLTGASQLAYYDPSDLSTLFQDSAGTTPVTTDGQSVGLVLDKSQGLTLGAELFSTFTTVTSPWTSLGGGSWSIDGSQAGTRDLSINPIYTAGQPYITRFTLSGVTGGTVTVFAGEGTGAVYGNGTHSVRITSSQAYLIFRASAGAVATVSGVSVRLLPGNHLIQSTLGNRPLYGFHPATGVRNLLTYTEDFSNAAWGKTNATVASGVSAPDGTMTAATVTATGVNGQILAIIGGSLGTGTNYTGNMWVRRRTGTGTVSLFNPNGGGVTVISLSSSWTQFSVTGLGAAATNFFGIRLATSGDEVDIWHPQLELGSTATAYQKVNTANGVTEAGVPTVHFLKFDGTDDFLVSAANVNPGSVDKAQVFAGVRKLSDAGNGGLVELSVAADSNNGAFFLRAPSGALPNYQFVSRGTASATTTAVTFAAPISNVVTGLADVSGDTSTLRIDGVQASQSVADQGTGNYLTYPLYVGRRAGTSLPFNGNLYSLIVRFSAANLDAAVIDQAEAWTAGKTGVTL